MAVLPDFPGLAVEILVNGEPLPEYDDPDREEDAPRKTTVKYIEAKSGAEFDIRSTFQPYAGLPRDTLTAFTSYVYMDGEYADGSVFEKHFFDSTYASVQSGSRRRSENGVWTRNAFAFGELQIGHASDSGNQKSVQSISQLGEISIKVWKVLVIGDNGSHIHRKKANFTGEVSEKALKGKALSHYIREGVPTEILPVTTFNIRKIDAKNGPFATYIFRYRSLEALKQLGIVPRTPIPPPLEERPTEELTREEALELIERMREFNARNSMVKRERETSPRSTLDNEDESGDDKPLLLEERPRKAARRSESHACGQQVIDLTED